MPRGDGNNFGSPRRKARGAGATYVPANLRRRLKREVNGRPEWPEDGPRVIDYRTVEGVSMRHHRPGSQNPRK